MKDLNLYSNLDEFVTGETNSELIQRVFENKTKSMLSKSKFRKMADGGESGSQEVYTPYEFLHTLLPKVYGRDYIVTDEKASEWMSTIEKEESELNEFVMQKLKEENVSRIYELSDEKTIENIEIKRKQLSSRKAFMTESELQAFLFCHPELDYKNYTKETNFNKDLFISMKLIMADVDLNTRTAKFTYRYEYLSGDLYKKMSVLREYRDLLKTDLGISDEQIEFQLSELNKYKPLQSRITLDNYNRIALHPATEFSQKFMVNSTDWAEGIEKSGTYNLQNAFHWWMEYEMDSTLIKFSDSTYSIKKFYSELQKPSGDYREYINNRRRAFKDGEVIFNIFLNEALNDSCKTRLQYQWNELYNNFTEQLFYKIPVALTLSKTFKKGDEFLPNETQIQSVQFIRDAGSGLLAYGVGVGKTASSILNLSYAIDHNLCKKAIFVVPNPTYAKWIKEIKGGEEVSYIVKYKEDGKDMESIFLEEKVAKKFSKSVGGEVFTKNTHIQGLLPHLPNIVGLYNLGVDYVKEVKNYSEQDEMQMKNAESLVEYVKGLPLDYQFEDSEINANIKRFYDDFELDNLISSYNDYVREEAKKQKTHEPKVEPIINFFKKIVNAYKQELPYILGTIKEFEDKTIFICTYQALGYLGLKLNDSDDLINNDSLYGQLFNELSQGEQVYNYYKMGKESALANAFADVLHGTIDRRKLDIKEFGFDYAIFDESHTFKKVFTESKGKPKEGYESYPTGFGTIPREERKYTIGSTDGKPTPLALSGWVLSRLIQKANNGNNVIHLTATPFTNKPAEIYSMCSLVNKRKLDEQGYSSMQDFFDLFMQISHDLVVTPSQKIVRKEQLVGFNNLAQMRRIIYSIMDYKSGEDANIKRPIKVLYPSITEERETTIPPSFEQEKLFTDIKEYVYGNISYKEVCADSEVVDVEEMSLDQLLGYIEEYGSEAQKEKYAIQDLSEEEIEQLRRIVDKLIEKENKEAIEEDDIEEKDEKSFVRILKGLSMMKQVTLSPYLSTCRKEKGIEPTPEAYVNSSPKMLYTLGCIKSIHDYEKENNLRKSGIVIYMNIGVNPTFKGQSWTEGGFDKIKKYLVEKMGYAPSEISIVHGKIKAEEKEKEKNKFLSGQSTILIGSSTISTGVDLQNNSSALFNLSFDWNPTDNEQINGRIHRQGNRFAYVRIVYPMTINSADPIIFELLNEKANRIKSIWDKDDKGTTLDLKEFDPNKLKRELLDDPKQKTMIWADETKTELADEKIILANRLEGLRTSSDDFSTLSRYTPVIKGLLTMIDAFKKEKKREEVEERVKQKLQDAQEEFDTKKSELMAKLEEDDDFAPQYTIEMKKAKEKYDKAYTKATEGEYDFKNDPEGRFVYEDYMSMSNEDLLPKVNSQLTNTDSWYSKNIGNDYDNRLKFIRFTQDKFSDFADGYWTPADKESGNRMYLDYGSDWKMGNMANSWKGALRNEKKIKDKLAVLGISFEQIDQAKQQISDRIQVLDEEIKAVDEKMPEMYQQFVIEQEERRAIMPTISERVEEFSQLNKLLKEQLAQFKEDKAKVIETYTEKLHIKPVVEEIKEEKTETDKEDVDSEIAFLEDKIESFKDLLEITDESETEEIEFLKNKIQSFNDLLELTKI